MQLPASARRVHEHTADHVNARIQANTRTSIAQHGRQSHAIEERLRQLDREWDTERVLETNASALALSGILLSLVADRRWLLLPTVVTGFLFQHGVQGWCPPLSIIRRLGVRTAREIEAERYALKAIRGDFEGAAPETARATALATGRLGEMPAGARTASEMARGQWREGTLLDRDDVGRGTVPGSVRERWMGQAEEPAGRSGRGGPG